MSETRWTSGSWRVDADGDVSSFSPTVRATVAILPMENEHDAHLIAAAPDLYEALEAFVNNSSVQVNQPYECERSEAALVKAHGEEPPR